MFQDHKTSKECLLLGFHPSVPQECYLLRQTFFECKRSIVSKKNVLCYVTDSVTPPPA